MLDHKMLHSQRGASMLSWIFILGMIITLFVSGLEVLPLYAENFGVRSALKSVAEDGSLKGLDATSKKKTIIKELKNRFNINDIKNADVNRDLKIELNDEGNYVLSIQYEARTHLMGNIDAVATFSNEVIVEK